MGFCLIFQLHEFHCGKSLERKELASKLGIPPEEIKQIMAHLAILRKNKLWHFRLPPDENFISEWVFSVDSTVGLLEAIFMLKWVLVIRKRKFRREPEAFDHFVM